MEKFQSMFPSVRAADGEGEEMVDPQAELRQKCKARPQLTSMFQRYEKCNDRVSSKTQTTENCGEELFDYLHELDHCVAHSLFDYLK